MSRHPGRGGRPQAGRPGRSGLSPHAQAQALTRGYNPPGYLDVYFLLNSAGRVACINSAPASTTSPLLAHMGGLT